MLAARPALRLVPGRCAFGHEGVGVDHGAGFDFEYHSAHNEFRGRLCPECGTWFLDPRPTEEDFDTIYPPDYSAYLMTADSGAGNGLAFRAKALLERLKIRRYTAAVGALAGEVLDVGCGDGQLLDGFVRAGLARTELVGIEFHPGGIARARAKGYRVIAGRVEEAALEPARYRLVVMNQLIEHLVDPIAVLTKLGRSLVPGGHVFIETPNIDSPNARLAPRRYWGGYHFPRHFHLFSPSTIRAALARARLEPVRIAYVPCPVQWLVTMSNWLQERKRPPRWLLRAVDWRQPLPLALLTLADLLLLPLGTANMQVVARRA